MTLYLVEDGANSDEPPNRWSLGADRSGHGTT